MLTTGLEGKRARDNAAAVATTANESFLKLQNQVKGNEEVWEVSLSLIVVINNENSRLSIL